MGTAINAHKVQILKINKQVITMMVVLIVGPKCTQAALHAAPW